MKTTVVVMCLIQIVWSFVSIIYDINNTYSASKEVATFLNEYQNENRPIYGLGYDITAIQPYFDHNIFANQNTEKSFWLWKINNGYIEDETLLENKDAVFVISDFYIDEYEDIYNELKERGYTEYHFEGAMFAKTYIYEEKGYYVLVK